MYGHLSVAPWLSVLLRGKQCPMPYTGSKETKLLILWGALGSDWVVCGEGVSCSKMYTVIDKRLKFGASSLVLAKT